MSPEDRDAEIERRVVRSAEGCCKNGSWRYHLCPYHQGFEDGLEAGVPRDA